MSGMADRTPGFPQLTLDGGEPLTTRSIAIDDEARSAVAIVEGRHLREDGGTTCIDLNGRASVRGVMVDGGEHRPFRVVQLTGDMRATKLTLALEDPS